MNDRWIAERMQSIQVSGIRKVFDLARSLKAPLNLSIGQPHFDVPEPVKAAAVAAIQQGRNAYTVTQGIAELRERIQAEVARLYPQADRPVLVTSGTSGGLLLSILATVNPGDEVILFDPYFVSYPQLVRLVGGVPVFVDTYPDWQIDPDRVRAAITPRTKMILFNSPANPRRPARDSTRQRRDLPDVRPRSIHQSRRTARSGSGPGWAEQDLRHDRMAARLCPRPPPADRRDDQAAAIHLRLRAKHGATRGGRSI
jgi:aspartate aminotransferase/aminotransferase